MNLDEETNTDDITLFIFEAGSLKHLPRAGWNTLGIANGESVAEHSHRVSLLGYILAAMEGANPDRVAVMGLFHDMQEARTGDVHRIAGRYFPKEMIQEAETAARSEQLQRLPPYLRERLEPLLREYEERLTLEAKVAKDADLLELIFQAREYQVNGYPTHSFIASSCQGLLTASAKKLAEDCMRMEPGAWWKDLKKAR